ncbi:MAG: response regulator [Proteobacteria bacterium]|nr:response regulator [Pseudomonadota bacterium]
MAHILIAENNRTTASYLVATLRKAGHSVVLADNCLEAWKASSRENFDVLLADVVMPGVDSFVLAQKALQDNPHLQVVFITGFAGVALDKQATPSYSPAPITTHPFHLTEIASRVRYLLGHGSLPSRTMPASLDNNIVYADFSRRKEVSTQQHFSS